MAEPIVIRIRTALEVWERANRKTMITRRKQKGTPKQLLTRGHDTVEYPYFPYV
jgi:hypothetical protein